MNWITKPFVINLSEKTENGLRRIKCENSYEMVFQLSSFIEKLDDDNVPVVIFRGVSKQDYSLIPSLFRSNISSKLIKYGIIDERVNYNIDDADDRQLLYNYEHRIIRKFVLGLNEQGISLPNIDSDMMDILWGDVTELDKRFYNIIALAQHNLLPTRLLDWTYNPLIAAFFAAYGAIEEFWDFEMNDWSCDISEYNLCIYALSSFDDKEKRMNSEDGFKIVNVSYTGNNYISAQKGLFTVNTPYEWEPIHNNDGIYNSFTRIEYPMKETRSLLRKLASLGISYSSVIPDYEGVKKKIEMEKVYRFHW